MDISKIKFRFKQFGSWRLLRSYYKIGVLSTTIMEFLRVIITHRPLKEAYPAVRRKIVPILQRRYAPLLKELCNKYDKEDLDHHKGDIVWFCWMQGLDQAPALVKACHASLKRFIKDKRIIVVDGDNYKDYVTIPEEMIEKHKKGIIPYAHFSDFIRLELLIKYGGTWIDSTVLCVNKDYPKEMMDCDLFFFQYLSEDKNKSQGISNWFISASSNNKILMILRDLLYQYWHDYDCLLDYYVFHLFFNMIAKYYPAEIQAMPRQNSWNAVKMVFHLKDKHSDGLMNYFKMCSSFHKLDYRVRVDNPDSLYYHILNEYNLL